MKYIEQYNAETYPEAVREIVNILLKNEDALSDGYGYYCGNVRETLTKIAHEILGKVNQQEKRNG